MDIIFMVLIMIIIMIFLVVFMNNLLKVNNFFSNNFFGFKLGSIFVFKFGLFLIFLVVSFLCSFIVLGCLVDVNFLMNVMGEFLMVFGYMEMMLEWGFVLVVLGNSFFCISVLLLLWLFGLVWFGFCGLFFMGFVWGFYEFDFVGKILSFID